MFTSMFHNTLPCLLHIHSKQFNAIQVREVHNRLKVLQLVKPIGSIIKILKIIRQNVTRKAKEPHPPIAL